MAMDKQAAERQMSLGGRRKVRVEAVFIEQALSYSSIPGTPGYDMRKGAKTSGV
jgi:hypothetical protein